MTSTSEFSGKNQVLPDEALHTLRSGLARVDTERAIAYEQLVMFRSAKRNLLERHRKLLVHKLGEDDPRVLALEARRAAMEGELRDLEIARDHAAVSVPEVDPAGYAVHGFVRNPIRAPVPGVTVAVYDSNGRIRSDFKPATTDKNGYFQLVTAQLVAGGETVGKEEEQSPSVSLRLRVFDANRKQLQSPQPPLAALPGHTDFREVLIDDAVRSPLAPPKNIPPSSQPPASKSAADARSGLKTMANELRKKQSPYQPQSTAASAETLKKGKTERRPKAAGAAQKKRPRKKRQR